MYVTLCTGFAAWRIQGWDISRDHFLTDHNMITYEITTSNSRSIHTEDTKYPSIKDIDWRLFSAAVATDLAEIWDYDGMRLYDKIRCIMRLINRARDESVSFKKTRRVTPRWWNSQFDNARAKRISSERKWKKASRKRFGSEHELVMSARRGFISDQSRYVNCVRYYKRETWLTTIRDSSEEDPWGTAYKILASRIKKNVNLVALNVEGGIVLDPVHIVNTMLNGLLPDDCPEEDNDQESEIRRRAGRLIETWEVSTVTNQELKEVVFRQKNDRDLMKLTELRQN